MDKHQLRLEVLKLANSAATHGPAEVVGRARIFENYVLEEAPPEAPPALKVEKVEKMPEPELVRVDKKQAKKNENPLA